MIPLTGTSLEETLAQMVLSFASGGGTPALDEKTITDNGVYYPRDETPPLDGYNKVTVNVKTYEEEYDEVIDKIHERDPDYDPTDPTAPTIPEELGYLFGFTLPFPPVSPVNPDDPDPFDVIGDADVVDENLDVHIRQILKGGTNSQAPADTDIHGNRITYPPYVTTSISLRVRYTRNGEEVQTDLFNIGRGIGGAGHEGEYVEMQGYTVDSSGNITAKIHYHLFGWQPGQSQQVWYDVYDTMGPYNIPEFIGFGSDSHKYKIYNEVV